MSRNILNFFRYTITNIYGAQIVAPFREDSATIEWNIEDEARLDYPKEFPAKILFKNEVYYSLQTINHSTNRCDYMYFTVERNCGGAWLPWFVGRFALNDANFNPYRCEVEVKIQRSDADQCLQDNKAQDVNLFLYTGRTSVLLNPPGATIERVTYSNVETFSNLFSTCHPAGLWLGPGTAEAGGWVIYFHEYTTRRHTGASYNQCYKETSWARQVLILPVADPSPGSDWILDSTTGGNNKWARPAVVFNCVEEFRGTNGIVLSGYSKTCEVADPAASTSINSIDNGMPLADVLQTFLTLFCPGLSVKSQFFQINPDTVTTINYVTGLASKVRKIIVYQKSDVKRPTVTGNATKAETTFEKVMDWLKVTFNVRWRVIGSVLRVEHISFFSKSAGLDLTLPRYAKQVRGLNSYTYKTEKIPQREEFKFMEASIGDFAGVPIVYTSGCVSQEGKKQVDTFTADGLTTDVQLCLNNSDPKSSIVSDNGFVFIAASDSNLILSEAPIISAEAQINNTLAWAQLQRDYHRHNRPLSSGFMNGALTNFLSVKPTKKGVTLSVPLCCGDTFNPDDTVETEIGTGTVEKAVFNFKTGFLSLDLLYPSNAGLYVPAVANGDVFGVPPTVTTNVNPVTNDVASSAGPITDIEIVIGPLHGVATVIAGPQIAYTPGAGYHGSDQIAYRVKDATGFPSNTALITIIVS